MILLCCILGCLLAFRKFRGYARLAGLSKSELASFGL